MFQPNNYFIGSQRASPRKCECCDHPIIIDPRSPAVYGSGRFCSEHCTKLRTPERHFKWLTENPEEYKKWQEWKREQERTPDRNQLGGERIFPI